jgi:hypothetical protein
MRLLTTPIFRHSDLIYGQPMARYKPYLGFIAAVSVGACSTASEARSVTPQKSLAVPPPPHPTYDPVPGPYLGSVDEQGSMEDVGVAANAIRSWSGPKLSAFSLCFQPASKPVNWTLALAALSNVSDELKKRGAAVVVIEAVRLCQSPARPSMRGRPHVEIRGAIRSLD